MRREFIRAIKSSLLIPLVGCAESEQPLRPNVILIMADDLGYGDISCYGGVAASTPNIDQMAKDGMMLTNYHSNGALSSPTRAALMTGKYQQRTGVDGVITAAKHREAGLALDEVTIAERLSDLGYNCGMFGKWHLGYPSSLNPIYQGFDKFKGFVAGNVDYHSYVDEAGYYDLWNGGELDRTESGYIMDVITQNSVEFIKHHDPKKTGEPFFLYVPYPSPHYPIQGRDDEPVRKEGKKRYIRKVAKEDVPRIYSEMIEVMDEGVGSILATLSEMGLDENTMVIFCSDNGPAGSRGSTSGYRGAKGSMYEGGHRLPSVIRYPAVISAGQKSDVAILGMDLYPTFVEMAGGDASSDKIDGVSMLSFLREGVEPQERDLFWGYRNRVAMLRGGWKMHRFPNAESESEFDYELYNMIDDPFETTNLYDAEPKRAAAMMKAIELWVEDVNDGVKRIS
ncbi:MAG: sulfatase-like hydrolase/transferase [Rikenellaceae bacterium]